MGWIASPHTKFMCMRSKPQSLRMLLYQETRVKAVKGKSGKAKLGPGVSPSPIWMMSYKKI